MVESSHSDMLVARPCIFRELTNNGHSFIATMIDGGLEMGSLAAVAGRKLTPFHGADGAGALQRIGQQWPIRPVVTMSGAGLKGSGPSQPPAADINTVFTAPAEQRPCISRAYELPPVPGEGKSYAGSPNQAPKGGRCNCSCSTAARNP